MAAAGPPRYAARMCSPAAFAAVLAAPAGELLPAPPPAGLPAFAEVLRRAPPRRVVDLTHPWSADFPTFDGKPHASVAPSGRDGAGFFNNQVSHDEHVGTHLDAPVHISAGGITVDRIAVQDLVVPAVVIDLRARAAADADACLTPDDVRAFEAAHGPIPAGAAVLLWSGWDERAGSAARFRNADADGVMHFPGFHAEAAILLRDERRCAGLGVDTLSLDHGASRDFAAHRAWLPAGRWGLEGLARLGELPAVGAVLVVGAPKVVGGSGGPTRAMALVP
jgi:kynurenine formamidase